MAKKKKPSHRSLMIRIGKLERSVSFHSDRVGRLQERVKELMAERLEVDKREREIYKFKDELKLTKKDLAKTKTTLTEKCVLGISQLAQLQEKEKIIELLVEERRLSRLLKEYNL